MRTSGPSVVACIGGIAERVLARQLDEAFGEFLVDAVVHVHALQSAAGLPGIEVRAVDDVLDGMLEIGIVAHVHRIATAELETHADESRGRRALHGMTAGDGARERHEVHARIADDPVGVVVRGVQHLEYALGKSRRSQALGKALGGERRLRGMLEHHHVAGHERGHHAVHRDEDTGSSRPPR